MVDADPQRRAARGDQLALERRPLAGERGVDVGAIELVDVAAENLDHFRGRGRRSPACPASRGAPCWRSGSAGCDRCTRSGTPSALSLFCERSQEPLRSTGSPRVCGRASSSRFSDRGSAMAQFFSLTNGREPGYGGPRTRVGGPAGSPQAGRTRPICDFSPVNPSKDRAYPTPGKRVLAC